MLLISKDSNISVLKCRDIIENIEEKANYVEDYESTVEFVVSI